MRQSPRWGRDIFLNINTIIALIRHVRAFPLLLRQCRNLINGVTKLELCICTASHLPPWPPLHCILFYWIIHLKSRSEENDRATSLLDAVRNFVGESNFNHLTRPPALFNGYREDNNNEEFGSEQADLKELEGSENENKTDVSQSETSLDSNDNVE